MKLEITTVMVCTSLHTDMDVNSKQTGDLNREILNESYLNIKILLQNRSKCYNLRRKIKDSERMKTLLK